MVGSSRREWACTAVCAATREVEIEMLQLSCQLHTNAMFHKLPNQAMGISGLQIFTLCFEVFFFFSSMREDILECDTFEKVFLMAGIWGRITDKESTRCLERPHGTAVQWIGASPNSASNCNLPLPGDKICLFYSACEESAPTDSQSLLETQVAISLSRSPLIGSPRDEGLFPLSQSNPQFIIPCI